MTVSLLTPVLSSCTWTSPAMAAPLTTAEADYQLAYNIQSVSGTTTAINIVLPIVATTFVILRIIAQKTKKASWHADDIILFCALVRDPVHLEIRTWLMLVESAKGHSICPLPRVNPHRPLRNGPPLLSHSPTAFRSCHQHLESAICYRYDLDHMHLLRQVIQHPPPCPPIRRCYILTLSTLPPYYPCLPIPLDDCHVVQRGVSLRTRTRLLGVEEQGWLSACSGRRHSHNGVQRAHGCDTVDSTDPDSMAASFAHEAKGRGHWNTWTRGLLLGSECGQVILCSLGLAVPWPSSRS